MQREFTIVVPPGKKKERLDLFLVHHVENATRSKVQRAIRDGAVQIDGRPVRSSHLVSPGETIRVSLPAPPPPDVVPEDIPLEILFEDEHLRPQLTQHTGRGFVGGAVRAIHDDP
jgi:23S rRNA pseudouridine1911/1915/1917 synthase